VQVVSAGPGSVAVEGGEGHSLDAAEDIQRGVICVVVSKEAVEVERMVAGGDRIVCAILVEVFDRREYKAVQYIKEDRVGDIQL
jgi:hypothetical protein